MYTRYIYQRKFGGSKRKRAFIFDHDNKPMMIRLKNGDVLPFMKRVRKAMGKIENPKLPHG